MTGTDYAAGGALTLIAGADLSGMIETVPRGWLSIIVIAMIGVLAFFVRRDYARIDAAARAADPTKAELLRAIERQGSAHSEQLQRMQFDLSTQIGDCVHVKDFGDSTRRIYDRINQVEREARDARDANNLETRDRLKAVETTLAGK